MREIKLTQGKVAIVDDEDFERLNFHRWHAAKGKNTFYAIRTTPKTNGEGRRTAAIHREVFGKAPEGKMIDHVDGNGLNNQKSNLRFVSNRQNAQNRVGRPGVSKYPGVSIDKRDGKWRSVMQVAGKYKSLGYFPSEVLAANAYQKAVELIGEKVL